MSNLVTFIVPAYNVANYIGQCLDSILAQSVEKEIIVIEDCSYDNTYDILCQYQSENDCMKVIRNLNRGGSPLIETEDLIWHRETGFISLMLMMFLLVTTFKRYWI